MKLKRLWPVGAPRLVRFFIVLRAWLGGNLQIRNWPTTPNRTRGPQGKRDHSGMEESSELENLSVTVPLDARLALPSGGSLGNNEYPRPKDHLATHAKRTSAETPRKENQVSARKARQDSDPRLAAWSRRVEQVGSVHSCHWAAIHGPTEAIHEGLATRQYQRVVHQKGRRRVRDAWDKFLANRIYS